jgi:hypothetical protein
MPKTERSKFERFVRSYGVVRLAAKLSLHPSAIYHWLRGINAPKLSHAAMIRRLASESGASLSFDEIFEHAVDVRASNPAVGVEIERRKTRQERKEAERAAALDVVSKRFGRLKAAASL